MSRGWDCGWESTTDSLHLNCHCGAFLEPPQDHFLISVWLPYILYAKERICICCLCAMIKAIYITSGMHIVWLLLLLLLLFTYLFLLSFFQHLRYHDPSSTQLVSTLLLPHITIFLRLVPHQHPEACFKVNHWLQSHSVLSPSSLH